jgi:hypothetical protein
MNKQIRHIAFTWNNYSKHSPEWQTNLIKWFVDELQCNYLIYGLEVGEEKETPHLQGYVQFKSRKYFNAIRKVIHPSIHLTYVNGSSQDNINYCKKDNNYFEMGEVRDVGRARAKQQRDWDLLINLAKNNDLLRIEQDNPKDYIIYYKTLKTIAMDNLNPMAIERKCLWIYGRPGSGKSRVCHKLFPFAYWKNGNKWWDGYRGEETVVLDDLDTPVLFAHLKRWADRYKVVGEVKGSSVGLTYNQFIVTSNFTPGDLGGQDDRMPAATIAAVMRRFLVVEAVGWDEIFEDLVVRPLTLSDTQQFYGPQPTEFLSSLLRAEGWDLEGFRDTINLD